MCQVYCYLREGSGAGKTFARSNAAPATGDRVALREATEEERAALGWEAGHSILTITRPDKPPPAGAIAFTIEGDTLTVLRMEIAPEARGRGYGTEAVRLLERWAETERGLRRFEASVPVDQGLALYFWLRLGYRPAAAAEAVWRRDGEEGTISMVRISKNREPGT